MRSAFANRRKDGQQDGKKEKGWKEKERREVKKYLGGKENKQDQGANFEDAGLGGEEASEVFVHKLIDPSSQPKRARKKKRLVNKKCTSNETKHHSFGCSLFLPLSTLPLCIYLMSFCVLLVFYPHQLREDEVEMKKQTRKTMKTVWKKDKEQRQQH